MASSPRAGSADDGTSFANHSVDWRAVLPGATAQAIVVGLLFLFEAPPLSWIVGVVVGAGLTAATSSNFRDEAIDAGVAGALGGAFAVFAVIAATYVKTRALPFGIQRDLMLAFGLYGMFVASMIGCLLGIVGALVGFVVAHYRERWRLRQEFS